MKETSFWLTMPDKTEVYTKKWQAENPLLIVQISHGMAEHINRYHEFASFLAEHHVTVFGNDHRGHGRTGAKQGHFGHFSDRQGFEKTVDDLYRVNQQIHKEHPGVPVVLLGHSMGSFLGRRYIQLHGETIAGFIISGTAGHPGMAGKIAAAYSSMEKRRLGSRTPSDKLNTLVFGPYIKGIDQPETKFDWLTRDREQVRKYIEDPMSGKVPSAGFFLDLFKGLDLIHDKKNNKTIPKQLPILFITGTNDPVGKKTADIYKVMNDYYQSGIENITARFYEEGRHEMLNELNRHLVYEDILSWLKTLSNQTSNQETEANHFTE